MSILHLLTIGRGALLASQLGLDVTGSNIANVNSPEYSRQRLVLSPGVVVSTGGHLLGSGVAVEGIQRIYDAFIGVQLYKAGSELEDYRLREQTYARVESVIYPSEEGNLDSLMNMFFSSIQDLTGNPSGIAERQVIIAAAESLTSAFHTLHVKLKDEMHYSNTLLEGYASDVNRLASEVAQLNKEIVRMEAGGSPANDLRDRREGVIRKLAEIINVTSFEEPSGAVTVMLGNGQPLVDGSTTFSVGMSPDVDHYGFDRVLLRNVDITGFITGGKIHGVLESREEVAALLEKLDTLSAAITKEFNVIHADGYGLDGVTGRDFFRPISVHTRPLSTNQGGAAVTSGVITDVSQLTLDNYEIRFATGSTYDIVNVTDGTVVAAGQAYTSGSPIEFEGLRIVISDVSGPPQVGDTFRVSTTQDMSKDIGVAITDPRQIAAAQDDQALPGDNRNALLLAALQNESVLDNGSTTLSGYYHSIVGAMSVKANDAAQIADTKDALYQSIKSYRDSVSGVSLEEEEIRLLAYQHSFEAAARYLSVVDQIMETLLNL